MWRSGNRSEGRRMGRRRRSSEVVVDPGILVLMAGNSTRSRRGNGRGKARGRICLEGGMEYATCTTAWYMGTT